MSPITSATRRMASVSGAALLTLLVGGCFSLEGPFDLPQYSGAVRGATTGPHVFFAASNLSRAFHTQARQQVLAYDLHDREVRELPGDHGPFTARADDLYMITGQNLVHYRPQPGGELEQVGVVVPEIGEHITKVLPAGEGRFLAGSGDALGLYRAGSSQAQPVWDGSYLDFTYDPNGELAWVIEEDHHGLTGVSLAQVEELDWDSREIPKVKRYELPEGWSRGPDPVVAGPRFLVVFDRTTTLEQICVIDKDLDVVTSLGDHMADGTPTGAPLDRFGRCDVVPLEGDRFLVAWSGLHDQPMVAGPSGRGERAAAGIWEVDLGARTSALRLTVDEPVLSLVPDIEGLVVGTASGMHFYDHGGELVDSRSLNGATPLLRGLTMAANGAVTTVETVGVVAGGVAVGGLAILTSPIWVPLVLID